MVVVVTDKTDSPASGDAGDVDDADLDEDASEDYEEEEPEDEEEPEAPQDSTATKVKAALIGVGLVALVALCVVGAIRSGNKNSRATDGYDAQVACKGFVTDRLKAPSTADFSDVTHTGSSPTWTVTGAVDAENSFGAKLRMHFSCTVKIDGDTWHLQSLSGLT